MRRKRTGRNSMYLVIHTINRAYALRQQREYEAIGYEVRLTTKQQMLLGVPQTAYRVWGRDRLRGAT